MKHIKSLLLGCIFIACKGVVGQTDIFYEFDRPVVDSLKAGIKRYEQMSDNKASLKYVAIIEKSETVLEIYLQQYSSLKSGALLDLINASNRKVIIESDTLPVLFSADLLSASFRKQKLSALPLTGYYIRAVLINKQYGVLETRFLF